MPTIALLEDEEGLREEVADFLAGRGHRVLQAGTLAQFAPLAEAARVAVLDVMLPDGSGFEAVRMIRERSERTGIIMLTALSTLDNRLAGFRAGADHYLGKPFSLLELHTVIESLLRRVGREWVLDARTHRLWNPSGVSVALSAREGRLMELLARSRGAPITRREIVEALGQDWASYDLRRLDTLVSRLRAQWQRETGQELPLKTLHGEGYAFGEPIEAG